MVYLQYINTRCPLISRPTCPYGPLNGPSSMRASHTCAKIERDPELADRHAAQPRVRVEEEKTRFAEAPAGSKNSRRNR